MKIFLISMVVTALVVMAWRTVLDVRRRFDLYNQREAKIKDLFLIAGEQWLSNDGLNACIIGSVSDKHVILANGRHWPRAKFLHFHVPAELWNFPE